jgi:hypothetical protein
MDLNGVADVERAEHLSPAHRALHKRHNDPVPEAPARARGP